ncbi:metal-dependent hydrolase [Ectothiorhodospiraceae bacterium 2226]|nr:metal-dependent hydrolase [Ectothiorhodospiraceae bacterium 2226]
MDSLTHLALGAVVGEATLGRRVGNKALLWGAALATVPDLDVVVGNLLDDLAALTFHRSYTHSLLFVVLAAPLFGYLAHRIHRRDGVGWRAWTGLALAALGTAVLLDAFTTYGVQLFLPFSDQAVALNTIAVIDPLFTLPVLVAALTLLWLRRDRPARRILAGAALGLSGLYLGLTVVNKLHMETVFERDLQARGVVYERYFVKPTVFNNLLWRAVVETEADYRVGFRSLLDDAGPIEWHRFPKRHALADPVAHSAAFERLVWVTKGYYQLEAGEGGALYLHDMRYGRAFEWLGDEREMVFTYRLRPKADGEVRFERVPLPVDRERERAVLGELVRRIRGAG